MGSKCCRSSGTPDKGDIVRRGSVDSTSDYIEQSIGSDDMGDDIGAANDDLNTPVPGSTVAGATTLTATYDGFKKAIKDGNDSEVTNYMNNHPTANLLDIDFENGNNCLHVAVSKKYHSLVYYLLTSGVSPNAQNKLSGDTSLHAAVRARDIKVVTLLCEFSADPTIENNNKETPHSIADDNKYDDIIEILAPNTVKLLKAMSDNNGIDDDDDNKDIDDADFSGGDFDTDEEDDDVLTEMKVKVVKHKNKLTTNAFGKLKRKKTKQLLQEFNLLSQKKGVLPKLEGFLEKKKTKFPYKNQQRWVIVKESYMLWNDKKIDISDVKNIDERNKFNNNINLIGIKSVKAVATSKSKTKFVLSIGEKVNKTNKDYIWKCKSQDDRDYWIEGLKKHINHKKDMLKYLNTNSNNPM